MHRLISLIPLFFLCCFAFSQKKNSKTKIEISDAVLELNMQKNVAIMLSDKLKNSFLTADFVATTYKKIGLQALVDSNFLQPYQFRLGKEIKPSTVLKINGTLLELGIDYWPFSFCPDGSFAGTAVWDARENNQPFLYDLRADIENNKNITKAGILKLIKDKTSELATKNVLVVIVYNSSEIDDSLKFSFNDTTELTKIPVVYFTKSGISKLKNESTIANAIDAKIVFGEKIADGTNTLAYLNNGAANTVIIATSIGNEIGIAIIFEIAKLLKEVCKQIKGNTTPLNSISYNNNNYLFVNFSDSDLDSLNSTYFLEHLPNTININYAINVAVTGTPINSNSFLALSEINTSKNWNVVLQSFDSTYSSKINKTPINNLYAAPFYKKNIPIVCLSNPLQENGQKNDTINKNDINTIHYIMQLISSANKYGKLSFNRNDN